MQCNWEYEIVMKRLQNQIQRRKKSNIPFQYINPKSIELLENRLGKLNRQSMD